MEILLHIGRHKTGTTSIQRLCARHADALRAQGILYPKTGRSAPHHYHHPLVRSLVEDDEPISREVVRALEREAKEAGVSRVLISTEMLARESVGRSTIRRLAAAFEAHDVRVVVYLRRQDRFLESRYAERVKNGQLAAPLTIHDIDAGLDYDAFLQPWADVFGRDRINVRSFNRAQKVGLLPDFIAAIDADPAGLPSRAPRTNERYPWGYLAVLRRLNRFRLARRLAASAPARALVLRPTMRRCLDLRRPLSAAERRALMERCADSNAAVAAKYRDGEPLFPAPEH